MKRFLQICAVMFFGALGAVMLVYWTGTPGLPFSTAVYESAMLNIASRTFPEVDTPFGRVKIQSEERPQGLSVSIYCPRCVLKDASLSREALVLRNVQIRGRYRSPEFTGRVTVADISAKVRIEWLGLSARGSFELDQTEIAKVYALLSGIVPEARTAKIRGLVSGKGSFRWPDLHFAFDPTVEGFSVNGLIDEDWYKEGGFSYLVRRADSTSTSRQSGEGSDGWLSFKSMGDFLPAAVVASEDGIFYSHPGYDLTSIAEASEANAKGGRLKRGGSTITQQLAKNLFLSPERTFARKLRELLYAVELDRELSKQRILELYLNIVEWGPDIFGAEQAAKVYFDRAPNRLRLEQAAWLASILRNPGTSYREQFKKNQPKSWRVRLILDRMKKLSDEERSRAKDSPIVFHGSENLE